jgi:hypothetical protein
LRLPASLNHTVPFQSLDGEKGIVVSSTCRFCHDFRRTLVLPKAKGHSGLDGRSQGSQQTCLDKNEGRLSTALWATIWPAAITNRVHTRWTLINFHNQPRRTAPNGTQNTPISYCSPPHLSSTAVLHSTTSLTTDSLIKIIMATHLTWKGSFL